MARNLLSSGFVDMISLSDEVSMIELDVKKDWVGKSLIELKFRDGMYLAVEEYDEFLKSRFSPNYMNELPDENDRHPSHCPNIKIFKD